MNDAVRRRAVVFRTAHTRFRKSEGRRPIPLAARPGLGAVRNWRREISCIIDRTPGVPTSIGRGARRGRNIATSRVVLRVRIRRRSPRRRGPRAVPEEGASRARRRLLGMPSTPGLGTRPVPVPEARSRRRVGDVIRTRFRDLHRRYRRLPARRKYGPRKSPRRPGGGSPE